MCGLPVTKGAEHTTSATIVSPSTTTWSGGAFAAGDLLLVPFRESLRARGEAFDLVTPRHVPHIGAALYAARLART